MDNDRQASTWVLVADARRARILEQRDGADGLAEIAVFERIDARAPSAGNGRVWVAHGDGFANAITGYLSNAFAQGRFARLVLVAPEPMLDAIYETLPPPVRSTLDLLTDADLVDAEPRAVLACLPGGVGEYRQPGL